MPTPLPLSVAIITLNEAENLPRCLESVQGLAAEIIVVDSGSKDATEAIAKQFGAQFQVQPWQGHVAQKNLALRACSQPWVLCLDADEAVSPELNTALQQLFSQGEPNADGFWINRHTFYLGEWINHAWYPEWRLRLIRKDRGEWSGVNPHDKLEVRGKVGRIQGDLFHYPFLDLQDHLTHWIQYAHAMGAAKAQTNAPFRWWGLIGAPWFAFFKRLILKQGWRDGWRGWFIAFADLTYTFAKYAFWWEKLREKSR